MKRALDLAERGRGETSPNPVVGCVIVKDGVVVGEGFHQRPGMPHAEVEAIRSAGEAARGADLFVNLEPCCHFGRTPPCTRTILDSGIRRVIASVPDPNPLVSGRGLAELEAAGIQVKIGVLEPQALWINAAYFKWIQTGLPHVTLKWAMSLDGKVATGSGRSRWITGDASRDRAHELRAQADAVAVGIGTVLKDDPELTVRRVPGKSPRRVIFDSRLSLPSEAKVATGPPETVIVTGEDAPHDRQGLLEQRGLQVVRVPTVQGKPDLRSALVALGRMGISSLLVEGGPTLHGSFIDGSMVDRIVCFMAPKVLGGHEAPGAVGGRGAGDPGEALLLNVIRTESLGPDIYVEAVPRLEEDFHVHGDHPAYGNHQTEKAF